MSGRQTAAATAAPGRIASIDAFRGLTILVMIFVNSIPGVKEIPDWFKHMPADADGMTFVDVVFPAFLFIVGMAIPFALGRRLDKGANPLAVLGHVCVRTLGLFTVGLFMVNMPADTKATGIDGNVWSLLAFTGLILAFNQARPAGPRGHVVNLVVRAAGFALLAILAWVYRGRSGDEVRWMHTSWWGIVGLIGWAYLVSSVVYVAARRQMGALVGAMALLYAVFLADRAGLFTGAPMRGLLDFGAHIGSHAAITLAGVIVGQMLVDPAIAPTPWRRVRWVVVFGVLSFVAGVLLEPLHGINKNQGTPAWALYSVAWCCWTYAGLHVLMDIAGVTRWAAIVRPAGEHPLLAYLLSHMVYYGFCFWPSNPFWKHATTGYGALAAYAALALAVTLASGWLGRRWLPLRL